MKTRETLEKQNPFLGKGSATPKELPASDNPETVSASLADKDAAKVVELLPIIAEAETLPSESEAELKKSDSVPKTLPEQKTSSNVNLEDTLPTQAGTTAKILAVPKLPSESKSQPNKADVPPTKSADSDKKDASQVLPPAELNLLESVATWLKVTPGVIWDYVRNNPKEAVRTIPLILGFLAVPASAVILALSLPLPEHVRAKTSRDNISPSTTPSATPLIVEYGSTPLPPNVIHFPESKPTFIPDVVIVTEMYVVQPNDTLNKICKVYQVDPTMVAKVNNLDNPDMLFVGQVLQIPHLAPKQ